MWSVLAMVVQILTFGVLHRCLSGAVEQIESNNVAVGALVGVVSLAVGLVNAACLS
jgi:putative membrane protein